MLRIAYSLIQSVSGCASRERERLSDLVRLNLSVARTRQITSALEKTPFEPDSTTPPESYKSGLPQPVGPGAHLNPPVVRRARVVVTNVTLKPPPRFLSHNAVVPSSRAGAVAAVVAMDIPLAL